MGIFKEKGMGSHDWLRIVTCRQQLPVSAHRQRELSRPEAEGRGGSRGDPMPAFIAQMGHAANTNEFSDNALTSSAQSSFGNRK